MKRIWAALLALCLLTGCASLLERSYSVSEPHSSKYWESEASGTLRAENDQDIVNDLLILIGQHTESATLRLYNFSDEQAASDALERAAREVQQETALGAYAVEYITYVSQTQRAYFEADLRLVYRRSAEQLQTIVNATSITALGDLLEAALDGGRQELAVRIGYWQADDPERIAQTMAALREERSIPEESVWIVRFYPQTDPVGIIEFLLKPSEEEIAAYQAEQLSLLAEEPVPVVDGEPVPVVDGEPVPTADGEAAPAVVGAPVPPAAGGSAPAGAEKTAPAAEPVQDPPPSPAHQDG